MAVRTPVDEFVIRLGRVVDYHSDRGLGTLAATSATGHEQTYPFHCTAIADGGREIAEGTPVSFLVGPVGPGIWEAIEVRPTQP